MSLDQINGRDNVLNLGTEAGAGDWIRGRDVHEDLKVVNLTLLQSNLHLKVLPTSQGPYFIHSSWKISLGSIVFRLENILPINYMVKVIFVDGLFEFLNKPLNKSLKPKQLRKITFRCNI